MIDLAEIPPSLVHPNSYSLNHCPPESTQPVVSEPLIQVERTGSEFEKFSPILPWLKPTLLLGGNLSSLSNSAENKGQVSLEEAGRWPSGSGKVVARLGRRSWLMWVHGQRPAQARTLNGISKCPGFLGTKMVVPTEQEGWEEPWHLEDGRMAVSTYVQ